jgi:DNA-binding transcriptional ArsR family regulator
MFDELGQQIQTHLDELLAEADKLRLALTALDTRHGASTSPASAAPSGAPERAARRARSASRTATRKPPGRASTASAPASAEPSASARASRVAGAVARAASGSTKAGVLRALAGGGAMTAGEIASATGLGRASVSTTLSKLASSGEVAKADRGYQLAGQTSAGTAADGDSAAENE